MSLMLLNHQIIHALEDWYFSHKTWKLFGDSGNINPTDIILFISKSGNTDEVKQLIRLIKKMKNKIINIGSISGKRSYPFVSPYTSSKHALEGFTDSLRRELLIHDVDVVLIEPGPIRTPIWDKAPDIEDNPFLNTEYEIPLRKFNKGYLKLGVNGLPPKVIGERILKILKQNNPKTRHVITPGIFKNYFIPGFLPDRWVDRMTGKMLGLFKKKNK